MRPRDDDRRSVDSAEATVARDIEKTWRNWRAFIVEQTNELAAQQADESPEADLTGAGRQAPRRARIDPATRQQFGAVIEARRQQAQARAEREAREHGKPALDGDQVYLALLQHILAELDGKIHPSGMALVWYKDALIKFDAAAVGAGTTDADYLAPGAGKGPTKSQAAMLLAVIVVLGVAAVFMVQWAFGAPSIDTAQAASAVQVGQESVSLWAVGSAAIGTHPVPARMLGSYPATLCVDEAALTSIVPGTTITLTSTQAIRRYQVQATATAADLLLTNCQTASRASTGAARLIETQTRTPLGSAALQSVTVRGSDLEPQAIPANQMEVALDLALPDAGGGTLILADGRRWSATRSAAIAGGTHLVYLVPLAQAIQPAGWELPNAAGLPGLLSMTLPAPTSRAVVLRRVLDVQASQPSVAIRDGEPELKLVLKIALKADAAAIELLAGDLVVLSNGMPITARWDAPRLTPGKPVTVTVRVPFSDRENLEFALASWRVRANATE